MVGLPRKVALELAAQTVLGAATMVLETGRHPAALKDEVTTPAGCTISALMALEDGKLRSVLARGVQEAARAAGELG
jgi:pyrroline-5-carboxylate reductase